MSHAYQRVIIDGHPAAAIFQMHTPHSDRLVWLVEYSEPPTRLGISGDAWQRVLGIVPESKIVWTDDCIDPQTVAFGSEALMALQCRFPAANGAPRSDDPAYREAAQAAFVQRHHVTRCI